MERFPGRKRWTHFLSAAFGIVLLVALGAREARGESFGAGWCASPSHFVLVHGAWHGRWAWYKTQTQLERLGHTVTVVDLPSHGIDRSPTSSVTLDDYVARVVGAIDSADEPVILVGHSLAGVVISMAAEARPDAVDKLVYVAAMLLEDGVSVFDMVSLDPESPIVTNMIIGDGTVDINRDMITELFYNMSPKTDVTLAASLMVSNPLLPMLTPISISDENYGSVPRYYISTTYDNTIPPAVQAYMYTAMPCEEVFTIRSDHSPFFSRPSRLTAILRQIARR